MVAVTIACLAWSGCAANGADGKSGAIGSSSGPLGGAPGVARADAGAATVVGVSPIPSDFRTSMSRASGARFLSKGHAGGRWDADVYANRAGVDALGVERGPIAVGAVYVEEHFERGDAGLAGPIMMMEKRPPGFDPDHGDWRYVVVGAHGDLLKDGVVEGCAGCHGDAPRDHVFRLGP
jgi:hypothetical protein